MFVHLATAALRMLPGDPARYDYEPEARRHLEQAKDIFDEKSSFLVCSSAYMSTLVCTFVCLQLFSFWLS